MTRRPNVYRGTDEERVEDGHKYLFTWEPARATTGTDEGVRLCVICQSELTFWSVNFRCPWRCLAECSPTYRLQSVRITVW